MTRAHNAIIFVLIDTERADVESEQTQHRIIAVRIFTAGVALIISPLSYIDDAQTGMQSTMTIAASEEPDEIQVRRLIEQWVAAFRDKSTAAAMALHAPNIVSFDIVPPLQYVGTSAYAEAWRSAFDAFTGPIILDLRDLNVATHGDLAYSRSLNHFRGTTNDGQNMDYWFRWTAIFQKIDGKWMIVHDHTSLPTDFTDGQSRQDLVP